MGEVSQRPMGDGPAFFADPVNGSDENDGTLGAPWRTLAHAMEHLRPGDTLYLREGVFFENLYCAIAGTKDNPITIRAYPGERAILDGSLPEFQTDPANAWEPYPDGAEGEFISTGVYRNIRDVVGLFGDSHVGLQAYWHKMDMRGSDGARYCGPGIHYDKITGRVHVRLAHTDMQHPEMPDYRGETDPRRLPLVIAPFNASPLFVDQAMSVRFQDLVIRGGGHDVVKLRFGVDIEFDNVTIYGGTYGLRSMGTGPFRFYHSAIYGMIAPWMTSAENALRTYTLDYYDPFLREHVPARYEGEAPGSRNVSRLPSHAVLVTESGGEYDVFRYPSNHTWDIAYSEFTDGHDGVYLSGVDIHFRNNWVDNFHDDALYLSPPTQNENRGVYVYNNLITRSAMAFGYHSRGGPAGDTYVFRNVVDLRQGVNRGPGRVGALHVHLMHGRLFLGVENIRYYQNTLVSPAVRGSGFLHRLAANTSEQTKRLIFNNLCLYLTDYPIPGRGMGRHNIVTDGNLHWSATAGEAPDGWLETVRESEGSQRSRETPLRRSRIDSHRLVTEELPPYEAGWEANSFVADPRFMAFSPAPEATNDYRLQPDSPAVGAGVPLPESLPDPKRPEEGVRPDIGALPFGTEAPQYGRWGRITFPLPGWVPPHEPRPTPGTPVGDRVETP